MTLGARLELRTRALLFSMLPLAVTVAALTGLFVASRAQDQSRMLEVRGVAMASSLAPACEYGLTTGNRAALRTVAETLMLQADVVSVIVEDVSGLKLAEARLPGNLAPSSTRRFESPVVAQPLAVAEWNEPTAGAARPAPPRLGRVVVELSLASLDQGRRAVMVQGLLLALTGLGLATILAWRLAASVTRPLRAVGRVVEEIGRGNLALRVPEESVGEVGGIERGINRMAAELARAQQMERVRADDQFQAEQTRAQVTLESVADGVISTDAAGRIVTINAVAEQYTGWSRHEARGLPVGEVFQTVDELSDQPRACPLQLCLTQGQVVKQEGQSRLRHRDGSVHTIQDTAAPTRDWEGRIIGAVLTFHDVTETQHMARHLAYLASHDTLTGLVNRREFESRLTTTLENGRNQGHAQALLCFDLDQFKVVNDTCGHTAGDELLQQLTRLLQHEVRTDDVLARLGGDEFGLILSGCSQEEALQIAEQLRRCVEGFRFIWQGRSFAVGVSIGLVPVTAESGTLANLLSTAEAACHLAKESGRNRIHVHQPQDDQVARRRGEMQWVHRLNEALTHHRFVLYAQRIAALLPLPGQPKTMYEILMRLEEANGVLISPAVFISAAERYQMMPDMDRLVITDAFRAIAALPEEDAGPIFCINLSGQSLGDEGMLDFVVKSLRENKLSPSRICFEITETAVISHLLRAQYFMRALKDIGCRFSLDDFGSGLSSFIYLKHLPVDYLKIDGQFIREMHHDHVDRAMVDAIHQIGRVLGITTIAECVENHAMLDRLREIGVDYGQGHGLDMPKPLSEVLAEIRATSRHGNSGRAAKPLCDMPC